MRISETPTRNNKNSSQSASLALGQRRLGQPQCRETAAYMASHAAYMTSAPSMHGIRKANFDAASIQGIKTLTTAESRASMVSRAPKMRQSRPDMA
eukprot:976445-Rhodomonas_salina.4